MITSEIGSWASEHWFLTFILVLTISMGITNALSELMITIRVLFRGWPKKEDTE